MSYININYFEMNYKVDTLWADEFSLEPWDDIKHPIKQQFLLYHYWRTDRQGLIKGLINYRARSLNH